MCIFAGFKVTFQVHIFLHSKVQKHHISLQFRPRLKERPTGNCVCMLPYYHPQVRDLTGSFRVSLVVLVPAKLYYHYFVFFFNAKAPVNVYTYIYIKLFLHVLCTLQVYIICFVGAIFIAVLLDVAAACVSDTPQLVIIMKILCILDIILSLILIFFPVNFTI